MFEMYLIVCWLGGLGLGVQLADRKGLNKLWAFGTSLVFGPFGVIVIGLMPSEKPRESDADRARRIQSELRGEAPAKPPASRSLRTGPDDDFDARAHFGGR